MISPEEREKERTLFEEERTRVPHLFERDLMVDTEPFLKWIGIESVPSGRPVGYLRFMPQDFIVEEVGQENTLHTVGIGPLFGNTRQEGSTYFADLVKIGASTLQIKDRLAELLAIDQKNIGYAGIKDRLALTSQRISIRDVKDDTAFSSINEENFFLKNISRGKGVVANGDLNGNRFTITIRVPKLTSREYADHIKKESEDIKQNGFWNFFYFQRFGTPRLLSHWLGLHLIKQQYEEVVKIFVTHQAPRELPYFKNIRQELENEWGRWQIIKEKIDRFSYHFHLERSLTDHLAKNPRDFLGALHTIPDQVRLWMYAYDCFLFNRKLSQLIREGSVPRTLPFLTSFNPHDWEPYKEFLEGDEVILPSPAYRDFPFIRVESRRCPTLQQLDIHNIVIDGQLAVFAFTLPKASYATTFLMNFFALASGLPIVPGIPTKNIDTKELLGLGTLAPTLERFKTVLEQQSKNMNEATDGYTIETAE